MHRFVPLLVLAGCPSPHPSAPAAEPVTTEVGGPLRGVAGDGGSLVAAIGDRVASRGAHVWSTSLAGLAGTAPSSSPAPDSGSPATAGPIAIAGGVVYAASSAKLRGDPAAILYMLDEATGATRGKLAIDATGWSVITSVAAIDGGANGGGVIVGGSFAGTLRAASTVVASAGETDGFVARITAAGEVAWLVRLGGPGADAVQGVAVRGQRIAIAGTFSPGADILGEPLPSVDEKLPFADAFAATFDASGKRTWTETFGSRLDDAVAGVAIDELDRVVVAATARDVVHVGAQELTAKATDALVVWFARSDAKALLIGDADADGATAIAAAGDHVIVAGYTAQDAFITELAPGETVARWPVSGPGREEVPALAQIPGGFVAAIAHTGALTFDGATLPAPADPMLGGALAVRPLR